MLLFSIIFYLKSPLLLTVLLTEILDTVITLQCMCFGNNNRMSFFPFNAAGFSDFNQYVLNQFSIFGHNGGAGLIILHALRIFPCIVASIAFTTFKACDRYKEISLHSSNTLRMPLKWCSIEASHIPYAYLIGLA